MPTPQVAGTGFFGTVRGYDTNDNLVINDSSSVLTLSDDGSADFYTTASYGTGTTETYTLAAGISTIYVRDLTAETITITADDGSSTEGTALVVINPDTVDYYTLTMPTPQVAGTGFFGTVRGFDTNDNLVTNDSVSVLTLSDDGSADFYTSGSYGTGTTETYTLSSGIATVYVRDYTAETITITADDGSSTTGTAAVVVNPDSIAKYSINISTPQVVGSGFPGTVTALDQYDNTVVTDSSTTFTMTSTGAATFYTDNGYGTETTYYTLASGEAAIYILDTVAETITVTAEDENSNTGTAATRINSDGTHHYTLTNVASMTAGGEAIYTVSREDQYDNLVTVNDENVNLSTTSGGTYEFRAESLGSSTTYVPITDGFSSENFYYYEESAGTWTVEVSRGGVSSAFDSIVVYPDTVASYTVTAPTPQVAGTGFQGTVEGFDTYSNLVDNDSITVLTLTDTGSASFYTSDSYGTGTTETYTLASGVVTIYVRDLIAETIKITAESDNASIGTSANVIINPDTVDYYTLTMPTPQVAGAGFFGTVRGYDSNDNLVINDSASVLTLTDDGSADFYTTASYGTGTTETYTR